MLKKLFANLLDQMIVMGCSVILLFVVQAIMKLIGFKIVMLEAVLLIIYFVLNLLYYPILESKSTIGKRILKLN